MRVVSLTCSNTEIVCALGRGSWLVGVDNYSDDPADQLEGLPRLGKDLNIDVDRVAELKPDLVLASLTVPGHERVVAQVEEQGLPFLAPAPESLPDVYDNILEIAEALDAKSAGAELVDRMKREITGPDTPEADRPRVIVEWWPKPVYAAGRRSWVTDVLAAIGACNALAACDELSLAVDPDMARDLDPDAVVISWCGVEPRNYRPREVYRRPGWEQLRAVQEQRVHCVPEAFLGRPGPRLVAGAEALRAALGIPSAPG